MSIHSFKGWLRFDRGVLPLHLPSLGPRSGGPSGRIEKAREDEKLKAHVSVLNN